MTIRKTTHNCWICNRKTREWVEKKGIYYCPDCIKRGKTVREIV